MFEIGLRVFILFLCAGVVLTAVQIGVWTVKPWYEGMRRWWSEDFPRQQRVVLDAVDLIEDDKVKTVEGRTVAKQIKHEVDRIYEDLERDLKAEYTTLKGFGVDTSTSGGQVFTTPTSQDFDFQAEVFKFDVVGFVKYVRGALERHDEVKTMIDMRDANSRVFMEISPDGSQATLTIAETGPSLKLAVSTAACTIVMSYLGGETVYKGLAGETFCAYMAAHREMNDFIVLSARGVKDGNTFEPSRVREVAKLFESSELAGTKAPIVDLQLASLYRLEQKLDRALVRLEAAALAVPKHPFVVQNLKAWRDEKARRDNLAEQTATASISATVLQGHFDAIRAQPALTLVNYPAMLDWLKEMGDRKPTKIVVLDSGYTPSDPPLTAPVIAPGVSFVGGEPALDLNGHGNMVTNLLAALLPMSEFEILPGKVLNNSGSGRESDILAGMVHAIEGDASVVCMALGRSSRPGEPSAPSYDRVAEHAASKNVLILAASGHESDRKLGFIAPVGAPANSPEIIAVGGLDQTGGWANFSAGDKGIDLAFPAISMLTYDGTALRELDGSMSNSVACAVAAAARSVDPKLTRETLLKLANQASTQRVSGGPMVMDALKFIQLVDAQK